MLSQMVRPAKDCSQFSAGSIWLVSNDSMIPKTIGFYDICPATKYVSKPLQNIIADWMIFHHVERLVISSWNRLHMALFLSHIEIYA